MKLIRDNRLFESILDNIDSQMTLSASDVLSNNITARADNCEVTAYFMLLFHSREQITKLSGLIEKIADTFYDSVSGFRGVSEFYTDVLISNPEFPDNLTAYPHNLLNKDTEGNLVLGWPVNENSNLSEMTALMQLRITSAPKKGNIPVEFRLRMNLKKNVTLRTCAVLVGQMFRTMYSMILIAENALRGSMSYMMKLGKDTYTVTKYRKNYDSSYRKCFMNLLNMVPKLGIELSDAERYIEEFTSNTKQKDLDKMTMPEELRKCFTPYDLRYVSMFLPHIEINGNVAKMTIPKYINVPIACIYYVWYYINNKYNITNPGNKLTLEAYVEGVMIVENEIFENAKDWYECIKRVETIVSRDTEFRKLNFCLMRFVYAEKLILINPVLQRTKYDSVDQEYDFELDRWKNPDVLIESPTHEIVVEDMPRMPGRKIIKAIRK